MTIPLDERIQQIVLATPTPGAGQGVVASPFQFLVTGEDNLRLRAATSRGGTTVGIHGRMLTEDGKLLAFAFENAISSDRTTQEVDFSLGVGFLVNLTVFMTGGSGQIGETFAQVQLIRGLAGATFTIGTMVQGYVTEAQGLGWPGSPIQNPMEGPGAIKVITGTVPAAGVEQAETIPNLARWEILGWRGLLTTDAGVGNREVYLTMDDGVITYTAAVSGTLVSPSSVGLALFSQNVQPQTNIQGFFLLGGFASSIHLVAGHRVQTRVVGLTAGDQWDAPRLLVREWLEAR